jgi:iron complex outermembrane recepter protein
MNNSPPYNLRHAIGVILRSAALGALILSTRAAWAADAPAAGDAGPEQGKLEEVIVTAQFRRENLQDTGLAITAVSGDQLAQQSLTNVQDLGAVIPNALIAPQSSLYGPAAQIGMRGVETNEFIFTTDPGVGVYIDDVYQGTLTGAAMDLLDLDHIEVLRGPQGTLFGKNSLGGAVRLISKQPTGSDTGDIQIDYGNFNALNFRGFYDIKITDTLFARFSAMSKQIDGYQNILDFTCQMKANGTPQLAGTLPSLLPSDKEAKGDCVIGSNGADDTHGGRAMLRFVPTDKLDMTLSADYTSSHGTPNPTAKLTADQPTDAINNIYQNAVIFPKLGILYNADNRFVPNSPYVTYGASYDPINGHQFPDEQTSKSADATYHLTYRFTDTLNLDFISGYRQYDATWFGNGEEMPIELASQYNNTHHEQKSFELRLQGTLFNNRLQWTTGAYNYDDQSHLSGFIALPAFAFLGILPSFNQNDSFTTKSKSGFVHGIFNITDSWSFTAGGRYTSEKKTYAFDHSPYLLVPGALDYGSNHFDWKLGSEYRFNPEIMAYVTASTGFRSDGAQPRPFTPGQQRVPVPAEKLTSYEIGAKTDLLDKRLRINLAAFYDDYGPRIFAENATQCAATSNLNPGSPYFGITAGNPCPAGTALAGTTGVPWIYYASAPGHDYGVELEASATPVDNLSINASLAFFGFQSTTPKYVNGSLNPGYVDPSYKIQAPLSGSAGAQYRIVIPGGSVVPRLDFFYQGYRSTGEQFLPQLPGIDNKVPGYGVVNGRLTYAPNSGKWTVSVAAENLFNRFYWYQLSPYRDTISGLVNENQQGVPSRPRTILATFERSF